MPVGPPIDLADAADEIRRLADLVSQEQLSDPTPCEGTSVGAMLAHILGLTLAFRDAATKTGDGANAGPPSAPSASDLPADWRVQLDARLDGLVTAWRDPQAWEGEAVAGGVTMPASEMGIVALDELVLHGWDVARGTGNEFRVTREHAEAVLGFTSAVAAAGEEARQGLFGPPVPVPDDASAFDQALGLAGRDPAWQPR